MRLPHPSTTDCLGGRRLGARCCPLGRRGTGGGRRARWVRVDIDGDVPIGITPAELEVLRAMREQHGVGSPDLSPSRRREHAAPDQCPTSTSSSGSASFSADAASPTALMGQTYPRSWTR